MSRRNHINVLSRTQHSFGAVPIIHVRSDDETNVRTGHVVNGLTDSHSQRSTENQKKSETKNRNTPPVRRLVPAIFASAPIPMVTIKMEDKTDGRIGHAVDVPTNFLSRIPDNNEISQSGVRSTELSASPIGGALQAMFSNVFSAPNPKPSSTFSSHSAKPAKCEDIAIRPGAEELCVCRAKCEDIAIWPGAEEPCVCRVPAPASRANQSTILSSPKRIKREPSDQLCVHFLPTDCR
ncbi:unnamed protein product [Calicophoron daubneyi]|uniref:Uncharacterized protein n=1 Tax=Calicophoron daubneyi TaxID=300641 RepID=A0AAV2TB37_CALDB